MMLLRDSVFSPALAQFKTSIPFAKDEPWLPRKTIESALDKIENRYADSISTLISTEAYKLVDRLQGAVEKRDFEAINKADWSIDTPLQQLLWGVWADGWDLGQDHGFSEVTIAAKDAGVELQSGATLAEFADNPFDNRKAPLRKNVLRSVIESRTIWLGNNVGDEVKAQIKQELVNAALGDADGKKIGKKELYSRVAKILGEDEAATDEARRGIQARAKRIARTELTAVYSLGRLEAYRASGLVRRVRYLTFEWNPATEDRPCPVCAPRNGTVLDLITQWQLITTVYLIPAHPHCRCAWVPIVEGGGKPVGKDRSPNPKKPPPGINPLWLGLTLADDGAIILGAGIQRELQRLTKAEREKRETRKRAIAAAKVGGAAISFGAIFYLFFKSAQQQGWGELIGDVVTDRVREATDEVNKKIVQRMLAGAIEKAALPPGIEPGAALPEGKTVEIQPADETLALTPGQIEQKQMMAERVTPHLLEGIAKLPSPSDIQIEHLIAMGVPRSEASKLRSFILRYLKWQQAQPNVSIGGVNLNLASVRELVASGAFTQKQAEALVAYTQKNPLKTLQDVTNVRYPNNRRAFTQKDINRLQLHFIQVNLNDKNLNEEALAKRFGIEQRTAQKIRQELVDRGLFEDWQDFQKRTGLSRDVVRRLQRRGAQINKLLLPDLLSSTPEDLPLLKPLPILESSNPLISRKPKGKSEQRMASKASSIRIEDTIAKVDQHLAQLENRLPKRERSQIDRNAAYRDTLADKIGLQYEQAASKLQQVNQQLLQIDTAISNLPTGVSRSQQITILDQQLNSLASDLRSLNSAVTKNAALANRQVETGRLNRNRLMELMQGANNLESVSQLQTEIASLMRSLDAANIRDPEQRQKLQEALDLLELENSSRVKRIDSQVADLRESATKLRSLAQGQGGLVEALAQIAILKQRLNAAKNAGFRRSLRLLHFN
ncbi:MAG TPA: hypothetical protein V6C65_04270 [Allocoleopsis sp.]